ncbi:hypothetical protein [Phenylobacterium sp.]|uniref:hypothetical protein n=1 Tax=Phenylobacterium sp. TaxID=1871053 RepID=UPI002FCC09E2
MADIVPLPGKRKGPGRPANEEQPVLYTLRFTRQQAAYLTYLAKVRGWAPSANAVARQIVAEELRKLEKSRFHERHKTLPTEIDDSADPLED